MTITIDSSLLLNYYDLKAGIPASSSTGSSSTTAGASSTSQATPWATPPTAIQTNSLVQSVLNGQPFINPSAAKLTIPTTTPNYANTKQLFALYQGLTALQDLATQASATGISSYQLGQLQTAFNKGMQQVQSYLNTSPFTGFTVAQGAVAANSTTSAGVTTETDTYNTGVLWSGDPNTAVPAFAGDVQFSLNVALPSGSSTTVNFNLNDMGSTPRTMSNVVTYLNNQLQAAGVFTRFADVLTQGTSTSYKVNGQTITNPPGPNTYSLQIVGNALESLTFSAPAASPAVYITQTAGAVPPTDAAATTTTTTTTSAGNATAPAVTQQLLKLTTDPTAADARVFSDTLSQATQNAIATATSSDGSVYVLANITGATQAGQLDSSHAIAGTQDVALMKYDSAGNLVWTQTLGSTQSASGLGLAVSADGSQIAVVGQGTGLLDDNGSAPPDATDPTAFVSVYDNQGDQVWSQPVNGYAGGAATNVSFGSDGSVYVAGTTALASGLSEQYLSGFSPSGTQTFNTFLGPTTTAGISGFAVDGSSLVTAGVQNGDVVVQTYALQPTGAPTLSGTQDLGPIGQGSVAGVSVNSDGSIVVAGSTTNGNLSAATVGSAYTSGEEAFVATLSSSLTPSTLAYYSGGSDTTTTGVTTAGGQVYITGQIAETPTPGSGLTTASDGFAAQIDPTTGAVTWSNQFNTDNNEAAPNSIAVDPTGASSLDALGLPTGTIAFTPSQTLVSNSALQPGDQFTIKSNFEAIGQTVTIEAGDTLQTLAQKIIQASGYAAAAQVVTSNGVQQLEITPGTPTAQITLEAGPAGENALPALGLSEGLITTNATAKAKSATSVAGSQPTTTLKANYGLNLESTLDLSSASDIQNALAQLGGAISTVKNIYSAMTTTPSTTTGATGAAPAYLTAEIANYQAALTRLESANSSSSST